MNKPISMEELKGVLAVMDDMLVEAQNENWSGLSSLDEKRRLLLQYEADPVSISGSMQASEQPGTPQIPVMPDHSSAHRSSADCKIEKETESDREYKALCEHVLVLDKKIAQTVQQARQTLLNENRSLKAQVSAKNKYAQIGSSQVVSFG